MTDWIDGLASTLGIDPLTGSESNRLLGAARDIAHSTERKSAPLGAFLVGLEVRRLIEAGVSRTEALDATIDLLRTILPEALPPTPGE